MNPILFLDKQREKLNHWLKKKTTMDFSDWGTFILFAIGLFAIFYVGGTINFLEKISIIVLWFTAIVILQYTKETYWLKQINVKQLNYQKRPIVKISAHGEWACSFMVKNIGKGVAANIELRISQIHKNGGFTNLRNLAEDERRELLNLGEGEEETTTSFCDIIDDYQNATKADFMYGVRSIFAIIATYEDVSRNPYYTIALFKVRQGYPYYILKTTKTGSYKSGNLEKVFPKDWLR